MPAKISEVSALLPLVDFIQEHGRPPRSTECRPAQGLCHYSTYVRSFHTLSAAISAAQTLTNLAASAVSNLRVAQVRLCLGCSKEIPDRGPGVRHCRLCRKRIFQIDRDTIEPNGGLPDNILSSFQKSHLTLHDSWDDLLEEAVIWCH